MVKHRLLTKRRDTTVQVDRTAVAERGPSSFATWLLPCVIFLLTFIAFSPTLRNAFVNWDDGKNIYENLNYRGLGWSQLRWMFTTFHMGHYQPLTWITLGLDYLVWGVNPFGYHLTSLILHAVNGVLFYFLALRLLSLAYGISAASGGWNLRAGAGFAALLFAIHPLRVESVAWATERRDVLSGLFLLWSVLLYLRAAVVREEALRWRWLGMALGVYVLSLFSKATGVTLPIMLLALDVYPLRRLGGGEGKWFGGEARVIWGEKVPFFFVAIIVGVIALLAQKQTGALKSTAEYGVVARITQALFGLVYYLWKSVIPLGLSPFYEIPFSVDPLAVPFLISLTVVLALTILFLIFRHRWPAGLAVWIWYVTILAPVLGLVQSGPQFVADRYSYVSCLGWAMLAGAGVLHLSQCWVSSKISRQIFIGVMALSLGILGGFGVLTWRQTNVWHDSETLWRYALSMTESSRGHLMLGAALFAPARLDEAVAEFRRGLQIRSDDGVRASLWYNLGLALAKQGKLEESGSCFEQALKLDPQDAGAAYELGNIRASQGKLDDAEAHFRAALQIDPSSAQAHNNLGSVLAAQGRLEEAAVHFREATRIDPNHLPARRNLGSLLAQRGELGEAVEQFRAALKLDPGQSDIHVRLAGILIRQGNLDEGIHHLEAALKIRPDFAEAHEQLGRVLASRGKTDEAMQHYNEAIRLLKSRSKISARQ
jgi:tetratricopeptide (TPR) repeat protein